MGSQIAIFMGPTWVPSATGGPRVGPTNLAIRGILYTNKWTLDEADVITLCILSRGTLRRPLETDSRLLRRGISIGNGVKGFGLGSTGGAIAVKISGGGAGWDPCWAGGWAGGWGVEGRDPCFGAAWGVDGREPWPWGWAAWPWGWAAWPWGWAAWPWGWAPWPWGWADWPWGWAAWPWGWAAWPWGWGVCGLDPWPCGFGVEGLEPFWPWPSVPAASARACILDLSSHLSQGGTFPCPHLGLGAGPLGSLSILLNDGPVNTSSYGQNLLHINGALWCYRYFHTSTTVYKVSLR